MAKLSEKENERIMAKLSQRERGRERERIMAKVSKKERERERGIMAKLSEKERERGDHGKVIREREREDHGKLIKETGKGKQSWQSYQRKTERIMAKLTHTDVVVADDNP